MTKKEARAILSAQIRIEKILDSVERQLAGEELAYAQSYWIAHIRGSVGGYAYGSAPIERAMKVLHGE